MKDVIMSAVQCANFLSAILGAVGAGFLYYGSYSLQPLEGAPFNGPELEASNARTEAKNKIRKQRQKIGLVLLFFSFSVQVIAVFLPPAI